MLSGASSTAVIDVERLSVAAEMSVLSPLVETSTVEPLERMDPPLYPGSKAGTAAVPVF